MLVMYLVYFFNQSVINTCGRKNCGIKTHFDYSVMLTC